MDKAGNILRALLSDEQLEQAGLYSSFFGAWKDIAGDKASHSRIVDIVRNAVVIEVDHPGWLQLLKMEEKSILQTLQTRYPELEIRTLRFVTGNRSGESVMKKIRERKLCFENDKPLDTKKGLEHIDDPRLKSSLSRLAKALSERETEK